MTRYRFLLSFVIVLVALCCPLATPTRVAYAGPTTVFLPRVSAHRAPLATATPDPYSEIERRIATLINEARAAEGAPALALSAPLSAAARGHSLDMAAHNYFDHVGSDGSRPGERMTAAGYAWCACGENIAAGYRSAEEVVAAWLESDGHRKTMLSATYLDMGVGYAYGVGSIYGAYYTVDFGAR